MTIMLKLVWLIPVFPLVASVVNLILGREPRLSERAIGVIGCGVILLSLLLTIGAFYEYATSYAPAHDRQPYVTSGGFPQSFEFLPGGLAQTTAGQAAGRLADFKIEWSYQIDQLSLVMMFIVTFVGLCIHIFAVGYMHGDKGFYRFFAYLNLFMFMMLVLVMASNFVVMFVGWEGVGLCSYLLIGYYFDRKEAGDAAKKAFVVNRIGDFGFSLAIFGIFATFGTLNFTELRTAVPAYPVEQPWAWGLMSWLRLGIFLGATGKSAQIPLYIWLPDAMAGPTPVSALIHAATMGTAGVYMIGRNAVLFGHAPQTLTIVAVIGATTALMDSTVGLVQDDIKRGIAYSTDSQLG